MNRLKVLLLLALLFTTALAKGGHGSDSSHDAQDDTGDDAQDGSGCDVAIAEATATDSEVVPETGKNNIPENTLDGDFNTYWASDQYGAILTLHLEEAAVTTGVELAFWKGTERQQRFEVSFPDDIGSSYTVLGQTSSSGETNDLQFFALDDQTQETDTVMLRFYGNTENDWNSIAEARVCGSVNPCNAAFTYFESGDVVAGNDVGEDFPPADAGLGEWVQCAYEGQTCTDCNGLVIYGEEGVFTYPRVVDGSVECTNAVFGDPLDCCGKVCYCLEGATEDDIDPEGYYYAYPAGGEECQAGEGNCPSPSRFSCNGELVVGSAQNGFFLGPATVAIDSVACLSEEIDALGIFGTEDCPEPLQSASFPEVKPSCMCLGESADLGA